MKDLTDIYQLWFVFALATLNSSDVVETITFKTETSLKLRDRGFIKNSRLEIRDSRLEIAETRGLKLENETSSQIPRPRLKYMWFCWNVSKKCRHHLPIWIFFRISHIVPTCFHCFFTCKYNREKTGWIAVLSSHIS